ncbi:hypothetical protein H4V95_002254 [Arthrobacter sp. CAN_C5]|nr:hypothetical protein [Arthrobacter sp. CAN_C5]
MIGQTCTGSDLGAMEIDAAGRPVSASGQPMEGPKAGRHRDCSTTAGCPYGGSNEELIARLLKERRGEVELATKFGLVDGPAEDRREIRGDAAYVKQAVDRSLQRLGTDTIDLFDMHRRDLRVPIVETVEVMAGLVWAGKVRYLGLSELTAEELREASSIHPIAAVQNEWSIWSRDVERNLVPAAAELGVGFVPIRRWVAGSSPAPGTPRRWEAPTSAAPSPGLPRQPCIGRPDVAIAPFTGGTNFKHEVTSLSTWFLVARGDGLL